MSAAGSRTLLRGRQPRTIALEWGRIGVTGFGGPPTHIALLRRLVVERRRWIDEREIEDAIAACNLLPGPASTQLAIFCARRVGGADGRARRRPVVHRPGGRDGDRAVGAVPGRARRRGGCAGAGAGAGAAVRRGRRPRRDGAARSELRRAEPSRLRLARWIVYVGLGAAAAALVGAYVVLVLLGCGAVELGLRARARGGLHAQRLGRCLRSARPREPAVSGRSPGLRSRSERCRMAAAS